MSEPFHGRHHRNSYSYSELEAGSEVEPPPTLCKKVQSTVNAGDILQRLAGVLVLVLVFTFVAYLGHDSELVGVLEVEE